MINFKDWLELREMSASGRRKRQAALGLAPPVADIFSRSTPPPWQVKCLKKALKKSQKKKIEESKKKQPIVHNDIDLFIKSVEMLAKDIWELDFLKKKKSAEEKMSQIAKRNTGNKPDKLKSDKPADKLKSDKPDKLKSDKPDKLKSDKPADKLKSDKSASERKNDLEQVKRKRVKPNEPKSRASDE